MRGHVDKCGRVEARFSILSETLENLSFQFFQKRLKARFSILFETIENVAFSKLRILADSVVFVD